jgi:hypothetical protein
MVPSDFYFSLNPYLLWTTFLYEGLEHKDHVLLFSKAVNSVNIASKDSKPMVVSRPAYRSWVQWQEQLMIWLIDNIYKITRSDFHSLSSAILTLQGFLSADVAKHVEHCPERNDLKQGYLRDNMIRRFRLTYLQQF